jgi:transcriptional regulator with XRE-family HTH domain
MPDATKSSFSDTQNGSKRLSETKSSFNSGEKSEETIKRFLSPYDLGEKIRGLRLKKKISLVDLGKHTGLSASMLSQLENGRLVPTLPTLARIAMVFDVGLDFFFANRRRHRLLSLVRAGDRIRFPDRTDTDTPNYFFECLAFSSQEKSLQAYLAEFPHQPDVEVREHFHAGAEFVHVTQGSLEIRFQDEIYLLSKGDSVYFDASEAHGYAGASEGKNEAIIITTPPRL